MKTQKGITLIALVITIIVMLILVGVTVTVAMNGGLFNQAQTAKTGTNLAVERERLDSAIVAACNAVTGEVNRTTLVEELGDDWEISEGDAPWTVTSENENIFTVALDGQITNNNSSEERTVENISFPITGQVGENATCTITQDGVATISGQGAVCTGDYECDERKFYNFLNVVYFELFNDDMITSQLASWYSSGTLPTETLTQIALQQNIQEETLQKIFELPIINKIVIQDGITRIGDYAFMGIKENENEIDLEVSSSVIILRRYRDYKYI